MDKMINRLKRFGKERSKKMFLVGGFVRDILLERYTTDFDVVIKGRCLSFAREFSRIMGGSFVVLDEDNRVYRVVIKKRGAICNFDFSQMRGEKITDDLGMRDLTIDAIALDLNIWTGRDISRDSLIDPYNGLRDLKNKRIRMVKKNVFRDDPLRMLRAYRLAGILGFNIVPSTERRIGIDYKMIRRSSAERIQFELFKILELKRSEPLINKIEKAGVLGEIMPEIKFMKRSRKYYYHKGGLWEHSMESLRRYEDICEGFKKYFPRISEFVKKHLSREVSSGVSREALLKLAVLFHDLGKPKTMRIRDGRVRYFGHSEVGAGIVRILAERLKFSRNMIEILTKVISQHMRPSNLDDQKEVTDRACYRFFRDLGEEAIDILIVSLADRYSYMNISKYKEEINGHGRFVNWMLEKYFLKRDQVLPKPLLRGDEIMGLLDIPQGPLVGRLIEKLLEAQVIEKVKNKKEARSYLRKLFREGINNII